MNSPQSLNSSHHRENPPHLHGFFVPPQFQDAQALQDQIQTCLQEAWAHTCNLPSIDSASSEAASRLTETDPVNQIDSPAKISESIRYSLLLPGKRIRPRLLLATAQLLGLPPQASWPAAIALEMIHAFSLIHDDLPCLDNDDFRRGKPSNHRVYGEATALLAGDGLILAALETFTLSATHLPAPAFVAGLRSFIRASGPLGLTGGQALELDFQSKAREESPRSREWTQNALMRIHHLKTGALFRAALEVPLEFSGISSSTPQFECISKLGGVIGKAFQVVDDWHDFQEGQNGVENIFNHDHAPNALLLSLQEELENGIKNIEDLWSEEESRALLAIVKAQTLEVKEIPAKSSS
jgi:geranylgeranyl diphosphate synthase type II